VEYGHEIVDTAGNKTFFVEGCTYCSLSTGGLHEVDCPLFRHQKLAEIRDRSFRKYREAWQYLSNV